MKKSCAMLLAGLLIVVCAAPASAWEIDLAGRWLWGYDYFDQGGKAGFFGPYDSAPLLVGAGAPHFAAANGFVGYRTINGIQYGVVTGSNASLQWMRTELEPEIRINQAVRLRGMYQIGNGNFLGGYGLYPNSAAFGAYNPISTGQWTQFWMTAQTPWGILVAGKRPFAFGMGAQYDGTSASSESVGVVAPYGPLRVGIVVYPWRGQTWIDPDQARNFLGSTRGTPQATLVYRTWDNDAKRQLQPGAFVTFSAGDLDMGAVYEWFSLHNGPAGATLNGNALNTNTYDAVYEDGSGYVKFNNGRFFANAEVAWLRGQNVISPAQIPLVPVDPGDGGGSIFGTHYLEAWKYMAEIGLMAGPTKVSFLYSYVPGPDRRHGIWINKQGWEHVANSTFLGNAQAFLPYSLLLSYQYGAGLNALNRNGEGYMTDAQSLGARLDYAVAANLNFFGSFFWANRISRGWPWGFTTLTGDAANGGFAATRLGVDAVAPQNTFAAPAPNIQEDNLGYEIGLGMDWKLLEGLTGRLRGAYWQPGDWFKFAMIDKSLASTVVGTTIVPQAGDGAAIGSAWAVNPNRSIDPIWGLQGIMMVDF